MGLGDEIMASGQARALQARDARKVAVLGREGARRWHALWDGNPRLARPGEAGEVQTLVNGPGCRPYVDYARLRAEFAALFPGRPFSTKHRDPRLPWRFTDWRAPPGELFVPRLERRGYLVVEPGLKPGASANKDWGWARWQALVRAVRFTAHPWVQLGPAGTRVLDGVRHLQTESFAQACTALSGAAAAVLPEGGLHHAAAALGIPAVVIFGGRSSPANFGYEGHVNLFDYADGQSPCGQWLACAHCARAMAAITVERVADALSEILR